MHKRPSQAVRKSPHPKVCQRAERGVQGHTAQNLRGGAAQKVQTVPAGEVHQDPTGRLHQDTAQKVQGQVSQSVVLHSVRERALRCAGGLQPACVGLQPAHETAPCWGLLEQVWPLQPPF